MSTPFFAFSPVTPEATPAEPIKASPQLRIGSIRTVAVLVNPLSGGVRNDGAERIERLCRDAGFTPQMVLLDGENISEALDQLDSSVDALLVLGGDGTARAAAERFGESGPAIAALPGGTMNLLPKALYGERDWASLVPDLLANGRSVPLAGVEADDRRFYVAGLFGAAALMARARESVRKGKLAQAWRRLQLAQARAFAHRLRAAPDGLKVRRAEAVALLAPSLTGDSRLEWVALDPKDTVEALRVGLLAMVGAGWRADPATASTDAPTGVIASGRPIPAILDGEPTLFDREVRIRFQPHAANVLVLAQPEPSP